MKTMTRRDLLKTTWAAFGVLAAAELSGFSFAYMQPRMAEGVFGSVVVAGAVDDFPLGSMTQLSNGRFYLARLEDGGFVALYQRCTHLGCTVSWEAEKTAFVCPCHNSQFDQDGQVHNPPAPRPLDLFPVLIENGEVKVDTSSPIRREQVDRSQVVYA